jgi:HEAT repeat protein
MALILIMSPASLNSKYVAYEWAFALGIGVKVVPVLIAQVGFGEVHPRLEVLQYLDFTHYGAGLWERLIQRLREVEDQHRPNTVRVSRDAPPAVQQAVMALDSYNPAERKTAVETLAQTNHPAAISALASAVQHPTYDVVAQATFRFMEVTQHRDSRATPGLIRILNEGDKRSRSEAIQALGQIGIGQVAIAALTIMGKGAIQPIIKAAFDEDMYVRDAAKRLLWGMTPIWKRKENAVLVEAAAEGLINLLDNPDENQVDLAVNMLMEVKSVAISMLCKMLVNEQSETRKLGLKGLVAISEREIGNRVFWGRSEVVESLIDQLKDNDETVREAAENALKHLHKEYVAESMVALVTRDYSSYELRPLSSAPVKLLSPEAYTLQKAAASRILRGTQAVLSPPKLRAIRQIGSAGIGTQYAITALIRALNDENGSVRKAAANELIQFGTAAIPGLCQVLKNRTFQLNRGGSPFRIPRFKSTQSNVASPTLLKNVMRVLGVIASDEAIPELTVYLKDKDPGLQKIAAEALERIGTLQAIKAIEQWRREKSSET